MKTIKKHITLIVLALVCSLALLPGISPAAPTGGKVYVLCYHSFLGKQRFAGDISMAELKTQVDFFRAKGFRFVSYADVQKGAVQGSRNIMITIDDGNQSVYQAWHEVFKPRKIYPVLGIYPTIIGKKDYALSWEKLRELAQAGCEIGAHGFYHELMNKKFYDKDKAAFLKEISGSKAMLEKNLGRKVTVFIYPNGVRADITKQTLRQAGYACAFTIKWGTVLSPLNRNTDPYELGRYMIYQNNWDMISKAIVSAAAKESL